jgi:putative transposase
MARLRRYQRQYARQQRAAARRQGLDTSKPFPKGTRLMASNRMRRVKQRIGKEYARVVDARRDHLQKTSSAIVRSATVICIEDLCAKGMTRTMGRPRFRRAMQDAALGELRRQITYKAEWSGRALVAVAWNFPSSKMCSACGYKHALLRLNEKTWKCPTCNQDHQRDLNAAVNIEREGIRILASSQGCHSENTRRSREIYARGECACAATSNNGGRTAELDEPRTQLSRGQAAPPIRRVVSAALNGKG